MCGIVGYFRKLDSEGPIGEVMLRMITAMGCRGPDSTGLALYGGKRKTGAVVRVKLADDEVGATQAKAILHALERGDVVRLLHHVEDKADELRGGTERALALPREFRVLDHRHRVVEWILEHRIT